MPPRVVFVGLPPRKSPIWLFHHNEAHSVVHLVPTWPTMGNHLGMGLPTSTRCKSNLATEDGSFIDDSPIVDVPWLC